MEQNVSDKSIVISAIQNRFRDIRCQQVEQLLSVMSNPLRFHLLCALTQSEFSVSELVEITGAKLSNISQQLKMMTLAGYIEKKRKGKEIIYNLKDPKIFRMITSLETIYSEGP